MVDKRYTSARPLDKPWAPEGARVAFSICLDCGASILIDLDLTIDAFSIHDRWHDKWTNTLNRLRQGGQP